MVVMSHPEAIEAIFTAPLGTFETGRVFALAEPIVGPSSIGLADGSFHQRQRRLLMPAFHGRALPAYQDTIRHVTHQIFGQQPADQPFCLLKSLQEVTLRVLLKIVFGIHDGPRYQRLIYLLTRLLEGRSLATSPLLLYFSFLQKDWGSWSPWSQFLELRQSIDDILYAEIHERRAQLVQQSNSDRTDILTMMLTAQDEDGQGMTDDEVRDELMTLLHSGYSTTSASLGWALYWIHQLPEVQTRLLQDLGTYDPTDSKALDTQPYLRAVCQETLRIYPVSMLGLPRRVCKPIQIMEYVLEPGSVVMPGIYLTHHRPEIFPEPGKFNPDRFLERQYSPYEYFPFGGGSRLCIGLAFAQLQMKLVLATLLSNWSITLISPQSVKPHRRGFAGLKPSTPFHVKICEHSLN